MAWRLVIHSVKTYFVVFALRGDPGALVCMRIEVSAIRSHAAIMPYFYQCLHVSRAHRIDVVFDDRHQLSGRFVCIRDVGGKVVLVAARFVAVVQLRAEKVTLRHVTLVAAVRVDLAPVFGAERRERVQVCASCICAPRLLRPVVSVAVDAL